MRTALVACSLVLPAIVSGQQPSLKCLSDVGVYVREQIFLQQPTEVLKRIPASTAITKQTTVTAAQSNGWATTTVTPAVSQRTATFVFREQAAIDGRIHYTWNYVGTATNTPNQPHSWLLSVPANTAGNVLLVDMVPLSSYQVGTAQMDIGNDGQVEINHQLAAGKLSKTYKLGTSAVDIKIVTWANMQGQYGQISHDFRVGLTLNPDTPIRSSTYGGMCGMKLSLSGQITAMGHNVTGKIEGGFPKHGAMLMLGVQPAQIPFPTTPCTILVNPVVAVVLADDGNGTSALAFEVPGRVDGVFYLQALSAYGAFGYTSFRMSNGVKIDANQ